MTTTTTTMFRMVLILLSMGIYLFTTQRRTPATIITRKTFNSGIINDFKRGIIYSIIYNLRGEILIQPEDFFDVLFFLK